ncbi:MAG: bL21 family ribosomal protein, partial [Spirochaetales bacterium]|nr:bL21 family ribosomal protein [Spirochaetales bacterium]
MYALVEILGKQYKAVEGETLQVDLLSLAEG